MSVPLLRAGCLSKVQIGAFKRSLTSPPQFLEVQRVPSAPPPHAFWANQTSCHHNCIYGGVAWCGLFGVSFCPLCIPVRLFHNCSLPPRIMQVWVSYLGGIVLLGSFLPSSIPSLSVISDVLVPSVSLHLFVGTADTTGNFLIFVDFAKTASLAASVGDLRVYFKNHQFQNASKF